MTDDERMPQPAGAQPPAGPPAPAGRPATAGVPATGAPGSVPPTGPAPGGEPLVEAPSPDVELAQEASPLPGAHRGGFTRLPTAPVPVTVETAPAEPGGDLSPEVVWAKPEDDALSRGLAGWALAFGIVGLVVSLFVGWGFPIGLVAVVSAIIALRRPLESRAVAIWAIALGVVSIIYSAGWLLFAAMRANLLG